MTLIFNASPLIVLAKANLMERILPLANQIWIPQEVASEVSAVKSQTDPARVWLAGKDAMIPAPIPILPFVMAWDLGSGESAVLSLADSIVDSYAVLDDQAARHCAQAMGLTSIGTLGLILMAKQNGLIASARQALDAVIASGLFISQRHVDSILHYAGE